MLYNVLPRKLLNFFKGWVSYLFNERFLSLLQFQQSRGNRQVVSSGGSLSYRGPAPPEGRPMQVCLRRLPGNQKHLQLNLTQDVNITFRVCWPLGINMSIACWELPRIRRRVRGPNRSESLIPVKLGTSGKWPNFPRISSGYHAKEEPIFVS